MITDITLIGYAGNDDCIIDRQADECQYCYGKGVIICNMEELTEYIDIFDINASKIIKEWHDNDKNALGVSLFTCPNCDGEGVL